MIQHDYEAIAIADALQQSDGAWGVLARAYLRIVEAPRPLTRVQHEILTFITGYIDENGYAPSFEEIAARCHYSSLATVHEHLANLERKGWIRRGYNESRAIEILHRPNAGGAAA